MSFNNCLGCVEKLNDWVNLESKKKNYKSVFEREDERPKMVGLWRGVKK